jgi:hypothetical protein
VLRYSGFSVFHVVGTDKNENSCSIELNATEGKTLTSTILNAGKSECKLLQTRITEAATDDATTNGVAVAQVTQKETSAAEADADDEGDNKADNKKLKGEKETSNNAEEPNATLSIQNIKQLFSLQRNEQNVSTSKENKGESDNTNQDGSSKTSPQSPLSSTARSDLQFVNWKNVRLSCLDDRVSLDLYNELNADRNPFVSTPGGDLGEFILALQTYDILSYFFIFLSRSIDYVLSCILVYVFLFYVIH